MINNHKRIVYLLVSMLIISVTLITVPNNTKAASVYPYLWESGVTSSSFTMNWMPLYYNQMGVVCGYKWYMGLSPSNTNYHHSSPAHWFESQNGQWFQIDPQSTSFTGLQSSTTYYLKASVYVHPTWQPATQPPPPENEWVYHSFIYDTGNYPQTVTTSSSGGGGGGCFVTGTKISTPLGDTNIENLNVGDIVLSQNENTNMIEPNKVLKTFVHPESEYLLINNLKVTGNHPTYVNGRVIRADHIQLGDVLTGLDGDVVVNRIERVTPPQPVYNLEVENNHNYFAEGVLVHNKGGSCFPAGTKILMADGSEKNIEDVVIGDTVLGFEGKNNVPETVLELESPVRDHLYTLSFADGSSLQLTREHPLYTAEGWKSLSPEATLQENANLHVSILSLGDKVLSSSGKYIELVHIDYIPGIVQTYNLKSVSGHNNFYADGFLAHNKGGDPGCPYVYPWDGQNYAIDNNILPLSENYNRDTLNVEDKYLLEKPLVAKDGCLPLGIFEFESEHTSFDTVSLTAIDHPNNISVAQTPDGTLSAYNAELLTPVSAFNSTSDDVQFLISESDGESYTGEAGDWLILDFGDIESYDELKLILRANSKIYDFPNPPYIYPPIINQPTVAPWFLKWMCSLKVQVQDGGGNWSTIATTSPREEYSTHLTDIKEHLPDVNGEFKIRMYWTRFHRLDFVGLDTGPAISPLITRSSELINATHNLHGDVTGFLLTVDEQYAETWPGDWIALNFTIPAEILPGYTRNYLLTIVGHYYKVRAIGISQRVGVEFSVEGPASTEVDVEIYETIDSLYFKTVLRTRVGINGDIISKMAFDRFPEAKYTLSYLFLNSSAESSITCTLSSVFGTKTVVTNSIGGHRIKIDVPISDDELKSVTGAWSHQYSKNITIYKNVQSYFELVDYSYNVSSSLRWDFGDGTYSVEERPIHSYSTPGTYLVLLNMSVYYENETYNITEYTFVHVPLVEPIPQFEVYQEVDITLCVTGRKDNTVTLQVYEDGILVNETSVTRQPGDPDEQAQTIILHRTLDHIDKNYSILLIYDATHNGENPTWLTISSGDNTEEYTITFNSNDGYHQEVTVDSLYIKDVVQGNLLYYFDASESYDIDGQIVNYTWCFNSGCGILTKDATGVLVSNEYEIVDTYVITLTVKDDNGISVSTKLTILGDKLIIPLPGPLPPLMP